MIGLKVAYRLKWVVLILEQLVGVNGLDLTDMNGQNGRKQKDIDQLLTWNLKG